MAARARRVKVSGTVRVPGDKSISHRALMVAALARGRSELSGLLSGDDVKSTARVLRRLGVDVSTVREPDGSRDHTERLLAHLGLGVKVDGTAVSFVPADPPSAIPPYRLVIPGDISSASFLVVAAVLAEGGELLLENVGVNPTRTGVLVVLERMGARVERLNLSEAGGEPVADLLVRPARLGGTEVTAAEVPTL